MICHAYARSPPAWDAVTASHCAQLQVEVAATDTLPPPFASAGGSGESDSRRTPPPASAAAASAIVNRAGGQRPVRTRRSGRGAASVSNPAPSGKFHCHSRSSDDESARVPSRTPSHPSDGRDSDRRWIPPGGGTQHTPRQRRRRLLPLAHTGTHSATIGSDVPQVAAAAAAARFVTPPRLPRSRRRGRRRHTRATPARRGRPAASAAPAAAPDAASRTERHRRRYPVARRPAAR